MNKFFVIGVCSALALAACKKEQKTQEYPGIDGDTVNATPLPQRQEGVSYYGGNVDRSQFPPVYFAFDSSSIQPTEGTKLRNVANFLRRGSSTVILAGFTDERGTEEYNRGLGERRAQAARNFLIGLGVDGNKVQTVSFGLEMPADAGHNDAAWARNRRVETGVVKR